MTLKTEILVITDRSGSMSTLQNDVIGGYNKFIEGLRTEPGECRVTYAQFDGHYEVVYTAKPLSEVPLLDTNTFSPRGSTALNDAIGMTLNVQGERIAKEAWAELVIVQIITDGGENASREYKTDQVKTMIEHAQSKGWKFLFLAANQDAFATAQAYSFNSSLVANYTASASGTTAAYAASTVSANSLRSGARNVTLDVVETK